MSIFWNIKKHGIVTSTQDILKEEVQNGAKEGLVIVAESQTKGRGRHGNQWISEEGNLYTSILLCPDFAPRDISHYSFIIGLSLFKAIEKTVPKTGQMSLKWPNDVLLEGKKCAGILLESDSFGTGDKRILFVGVGVNIKSFPTGKIGLEAIARKDIDPMFFLELFLNEIKKYMELYDIEGFSAIREQWLSHAAYIGKTIQARFAKTTLEGRFIDIDAQGALILEQADKKRIAITAGEIFNI